jgi:hypothetical protein
MNEKGRFYQKLRFHVRIFFLAACLPFYNEWADGLKGLYLFLLNLAKYIYIPILFRGSVERPADIWTPFNSSIVFIIMWCLCYLLFYRLSLFIIVQFILPVKKWEDRKKAFNRIHLFARGKHGPAISIKKGERIARHSEIDSKKPGVALVDLSSAIVLAQYDNAKAWYLPDEEEIIPAMKKKRPNKFPWQAKGPEPSFYDAKGPGVVFIEKGQRIDGIIDLRRQARACEDVEVYTRNGIKIKSKVTIEFSLSDDTEILSVGFVDGKDPFHLKVLKLKEDAINLSVEGIFDLDPYDANAIINSLNITPVPAGTVPPSNSPYKFDKDRVLRAALSQARNKSGEAIFWHEAPIEIATDIFRATLSEIPYDSLFNDSSILNLRNVNGGDINGKEDGQGSEKDTSQTLSKIKDIFLFKVKQRGMISYRFIEHLGGSTFQQGQNIPLISIKKYAPVTFTGERFNYFRDRGIVVKNATFGEILAVEKEIQKRMAKNWMAKMKNEIAVSNAEYELEAIRVHNRNRALLQEEMTHLLAGVFQSTPHFDEALALRVLQALETSITEMSDADMQSIDVYELLKNLHDWILFDESHGEPPNNGTAKIEHDDD